MIDSNKATLSRLKHRESTRDKRFVGLRKLNNIIAACRFFSIDGLLIREIRYAARRRRRTCCLILVAFLESRKSSPQLRASSLREYSTNYPIFPGSNQTLQPRKICLITSQGLKEFKAYSSKLTWVELLMRPWSERQYSCKTQSVLDPWGGFPL
ncbi:hypothetical protein HPP92_011761 [Vanilla planifolia]|uniref:Uncharacterized protein n=1 Tax=Vanilla planifolia TaxID=51239 RepID=A0A835R6P4_VANPL|nr:hypothetical protein HPP92_011761 [Vanilla planifolia]